MRPLPSKYGGGQGDFSLTRVFQEERRSNQAQRLGNWPGLQATDLHACVGNPVFSG